MSVRFNSKLLTILAAATFSLLLIPTHAAPQQNAAVDAKA